jgi:hypothetical protein
MRLAVPALLALAITGSRAAELRVLRVTPTGDAAPTTQITITFDRPVAGSLDRTVDPATIVRVTPPVTGTLEWRDPITIRLRPAGLLPSGTTVTVTVDTTFAAMDGARLAAPYTFAFRVRGAEVIGGSPVFRRRDARHLTPTTSFDIVVGTPVDLPRLANVVRAEFEPACRAALIPLRPVSQRPITNGDRWEWREAGGWDRDRSYDSLRRVVTFRPTRPLPLNCAAVLRVPTYLEPDATTYEQWSFWTYGPLVLARASCGWGDWQQACPTGPVRVQFTTPVRGSEVLRAVKLLPATAFTVDDTAEVQPTWMLETKLRPRTGYAVVVDTSIRDVFGQRLTLNPVATVVTTGYEPSVSYPAGQLLVEREGFRTLAVQHINVDTLLVTQVTVPESLEARAIATPAWRTEELWQLVTGAESVRAVPVTGRRDAAMLSGVRAPAYNAARPGAPTLTLLRIGAATRDTGRRLAQPTAVVQVTDLAVHARIGADDGAVWVTGVTDGRPRAGARVTFHDVTGRARASAVTDAQGLARLTGLGGGTESDDDMTGSVEGYVAATLGTDRALVAVDRWGNDLAPWRFNLDVADAGERLPAAAAVFTERGIYRPGEAVHAKAIVRRGALGALTVPAAADSVRWTFHDRDGGTLRDTTVAPSPFGTADQTVSLPDGAPLGTYVVNVSLKQGGEWTGVARTSYRVAEYRAPEFLVSVAADSGPSFGGDSLGATVEARYLFGAPMARAAVFWDLRQRALPFWELDIPGVEDWYVGESGWWWEDAGERGAPSWVVDQRADTLDERGRLVVRVRLPQPQRGRPARATLGATVTDVNRQAVSAGATVTVHPAAFYVAAKPLGAGYFWTAGTPQRLAAIVVRPTGERVSGVPVRVAVIRREWHRVQRERDGWEELAGEWVSDTVARCDVVSATEPATCAYTPDKGGTYIVRAAATDPAGRDAVTTFYRWATGRDWVPWSDETQFKMDVIPDRTRYSVGDTATLLLAAPFTDVEGWLTVEREGIIEERRLRITSGATTIKLPITERLAPNAYVSVLIARGRSAPPGSPADAGRPTIRVGYAELRVTPVTKRLTVDVTPLQAEYRPGDTARVRLRVRDAAGTGRRSEVTLWAVDEGVLALTGYRTPDLIDLIYRRRALGVRLASGLTNVAAQVLEQEGQSRKDQEPGGGGGGEGGEVLRSRFSSTAFFLGSVVTDERGEAVAAARLPDNLTTFRVMAVAVTAGDRYGGGQSSLLVTRPLLARPALPRFLRGEDAFTAGVVVNHRLGGTPTVRVTAEATGITLDGAGRRDVTLAAGRGSEVRFPFRTAAQDSATFRLRVASGREGDGVQLTLPVRPSHHPRGWTTAGLLSDTATIDLALPGDLDPARSRLELSLGASPLAVIRGVERHLRVYPYYCTEQIASAAVPLATLLRADVAPPAARRNLERAVATLSRRQRGDGGIGLWDAADWTSPWLSAHAGEVLLDARAAGVAVDSAVLARLAGYLRRWLHESRPLLTPVARWIETTQGRLSERVAAADFLSRYGTPDIAVENDLYRGAPQMTWESRLRLAEVVARRDLRTARALVAPAWQGVRVEGRRAVLPADVDRFDFYFASSARPAARLLTATLAVDSTHALVAPLVETLIGAIRASRYWWNTQDWAGAVGALAALERRQARATGRVVRLVAQGRTVLALGGPNRPLQDSTLALTGLVTGDSAATRLRVQLVAGPTGDGTAPLIYYFATVREVPRRRPVTPDQEGIQVERWYEDYRTGRPITSIAAGELVRVRLRITLPADRQFVVLDDPLPAGLEAIDLSLRTTGLPPGPGRAAEPPSGGPTEEEAAEGEAMEGRSWGWYYGSWDSGWWSPFDHRELRDDRVVYAATFLWKGTYTATYLARATTPGTFVRPPAHAEEMYNPAVRGRSDGGVFTVTER